MKQVDRRLWKNSDTWELESVEILVEFAIAKKRSYSSIHTSEAGMDRGIIEDDSSSIVELDSVDSSSEEINQDKKRQK